MLSVEIHIVPAHSLFHTSFFNDSRKTVRASLCVFGELRVGE